VLLERALPAARTIVIATHIPPFAEALPLCGHLADPDWPPLLVCGATGAVIREVASNHPGTEFLVLCGHTHVATDATVMGNVRCLVRGEN
jgi:Icc protein